MRTRASSLRLKLTVWFVLVFSLIQGVFVLAVVLFRREFIQRDLDVSLEKSAKQMIDSLISVGGGQWSDEMLETYMPAGSGFLIVAIRDPEGQGLARLNVQDEGALPFSPNETVPTGPLGPVTTTIGPERARALTGKEQRLRLITVPFRQGNRRFFFQAAADDRVLEQLLGPFLDLVVIGMPVGAFAACVAAWVIAGRAMAPIRRLSLAAQRVSPERLGERFRVATTDEEISLLEEELNSALQRIEEGYAAQEQFISNVSHELKTPIAVLLTEAQVARMGAMTEERAVAFTRKAEREMQRLGRLVESFLTLARADLPRGFAKQPVPVNDLVLECVQRSRPLADMHHVRLVPLLASEEDEDDELRVSGDVELLHSAVENLIRNAVQHSPADEPVEVRVRHDGDEVTITVSDHGPGIPEEHAATIFERFRQVPGQRSHGGSGLGLAIAKHVVELHGGRVSLTPGPGCSMSVHLPLRPPEAS